MLKSPGVVINKNPVPIVNPFPMPRKTLKRRTAKKRGGAKKYFKKFGTYYVETNAMGEPILGEIAPVGEEWVNLDHVEPSRTPEGVDD